MYNTRHFKPKPFFLNLTGKSKKKLQRNQCKTELNVKTENIKLVFICILGRFYNRL